MLSDSGGGGCVMHTAASGAGRWGGHRGEHIFCYRSELGC